MKRSVSLKVLTGEDKMDATAILSYFEPLTEYLERQNEGRRHALPETPAI